MLKKSPRCLSTATLVACLTICSALVTAPATSAEAPPPKRDTIMIDDHPFTLWSRVAKQPKQVILLIHGRTWSALPDFDLQVPQFPRSVMQALEQKHYAVYALDLRGYGNTPRDASGWNTPTRAVHDIVATLKWIRLKHPTLNKPALLGWSMGALLSQLTAQQHPELISNLILYGYPRDPANPPTLAPDPEFPPREKNTAERAASDFISPAVTPKVIIDTYIKAALKADPTRADWRGLDQYLALDGAKIKNPTLLIHGERDPLTKLDAQSRLFISLGNADKQWVVLAGGDHAAMIENTHEAFITAIDSFINRPKLHECDCKNENAGR